MQTIDALLKSSVIVKCAERVLSRHTTDPATAGDAALSFVSLLALELCNQDTEAAALLLDVVDMSSATTPQEEKLQLFLQCLGLLVNRVSKLSTPEERAFDIGLALPGLLSQLAPKLAEDLANILIAAPTVKDHQ